MIFRDRHHAGVLLAKELAPRLEENHSNTVVLALPRGGVPVGEVIASRFSLPLNVLVVRKIGAPFNREFAIGAICENSEPVISERYLHAYAVSDADLTALINEERNKIKRQVEQFRHGEKLSNLAGKTVIVVDDGLATGATMIAAVRFLKNKNVERIIIAAPIASATAISKIQAKVDQVVFVEQSEQMMAVGEWYDDFSQVSDDDVEKILKKGEIAPKGAQGENYGNRAKTN